MSRLAIKGGDPVRGAPWPAWPVFDARDIAAVSEVVQSGQWGGHPYPGPNDAISWSVLPQCKAGDIPSPWRTGR